MNFEPKSRASFSSSFTVNLRGPQYFGPPYMQTSDRTGRSRKPYERDKMREYGRIWKKKTFKIQKGFISAIFIVQSEQILELTR